MKREDKMWQQWVNLVLGIWLVILPWLGLTYESLQVWVLIVGIAVAIMSIWGALSVNTYEKR